MELSRPSHSMSRPLVAHRAHMQSCVRSRVIARSSVPISSSMSHPFAVAIAVASSERAEVTGTVWLAMLEKVLLAAVTTRGSGLASF